MPNIRITPKLRILPLLLAALLVLELLWSERVWMMLLVALGSIWGLDLVWARTLARGLRFHRELRYDWAHVGDELEERYTLTNTQWAPALWVEITDHSTLPDYQLRLGTGIGGNSEHGWRMKHVCTRRGIFSLGPTTLITGTPFHLYTIEFEYDARTALMVMPPVVPLPEIQVAPGGRAHEGPRRASTFERTVSASSVREYRPYDPYKTIHWRAVAHHDELMVRTFESTPAGDWWIWLDLDAHAQAGEGENSTVEHSVILAASLAARGIAGGRAVGLVANAQELVWLAPQAGEAQRLEILRTLATVEPSARSLAELLGQTPHSLHRNASVVIITPALEGAWLDAALALRRGGAAPTVLLLDRATYGGDGNPDRVMALLAEWNIPRYAITQDVLGRSEPDTARQGHWEFSVGATGRAIARAAPGEQEWRTLA